MHRFVEFSRDFYSDPTPCERAGGTHRRPVPDLVAAFEAAYAGDGHGAEAMPIGPAIHAESEAAIP